MTTKDFTIKNYYTQDIPIDDGFDGEAVQSGETFPIRISRFTVSQLQHFQRGFARLTDPSASRFIYRKPDGDEQAMRAGVAGRQEHVIPDAEIERRRREEMTTAARAEYEAASLADDAFMAAFCCEAIRQFVHVAPGCNLRMEQEGTGEPVPVKTGADLVQAFGGNLSMLVRLTRAIHQENTLSPEAKKALRSLSGSTASSPTRAAVAAVDGATPAATVASAAPEGSAPSAGVLADPDPIPSGSGVLVGMT